MTTYRDADGSEFFVLPSGEAVRADGSPHTAMDAPPAGACPTCGRDHKGGRYDVIDVNISDDARRLVEAVRRSPPGQIVAVDSHAGCIDRAEVARVLAAYHGEVRARLDNPPSSYAELQASGQLWAVRDIANRLGLLCLLPEFRAALASKDGAP